MTQKTLAQTSKDYVAPITLNITDLERVDLTWPIETKTGTDKDGKEFTYDAMIVNEQEFRVPGPVLGEIKNMLELKPDLRYVRVTKTGSGKGTRYSVRQVSM